MDIDVIEKKERWLNRVQNARRYYSYQRWRDKPKNQKISIFVIIQWVFDDVFYLIKWNINLFLQLRAYGKIVKRYSGLSYFEQWKRMAYLVFIVRTDSSKLRGYHLFDPGRWQNITKFSFGRHNLIHAKNEGFVFEDESKLLRNKYEFYQFSKNFGWNTPSIHGIIENAEIIFTDQKSFRFPKKDLFIKQMSGGMGEGAKYLKYREEAYHDSDGKKFNEDELSAYLIKSANPKSLIVQEAVKNHEKWKKFSNGSLATCRLVTGKSPYNDEIIPFFATFRMPVGNADVDNFSQNGIAAQINVKTGELGMAISSKPINDSFVYDFHPDTGERITGAKLYYWDEVIEFTKTIHRNFKTLSVGWDVSLTEDGLCMIEGNEFWGSDVIEAPGNLPIYDTQFPEWVESWIEVLSNTPSANILLDEHVSDVNHKK